jgi:hypothetical protein
MAEITIDEWRRRAEYAEKRLEELDDTPTGSHHGDPVLMRRDISLLEAHSEWVQLLWKHDKHSAGRLPHYPDWLKSRLFWRIRSGKEPLPFPPPTAYSCPWYEVIEVPEAHDCYELIQEREGRVRVAQCSYTVVSKGDDGKWELSYGPYLFDAWNGPVTHKQMGNNGPETVTRECGWIQYRGIAAPEAPDVPVRE